MWNKIKVVFSTLAGSLWFLGGQDGYSKAVRRIGVAALVTLSIAWKLDVWNAWLAVSALLSFGAYSLGYGITDATDDGSHICQFWTRWVDWQTKPVLLRILTRATTGLAYGLTYLFWGILGQATLSHALLALVLTVVAIPVIVEASQNSVKKESLGIGTWLLAIVILL